MAKATTGATKAGAHLQQARDFLARVALIDGHNDLPYVIRNASGGDLKAFALTKNGRGRDTDIPKLQAGQVAAQFFAAYVPPDEKQPASYAFQQIALVRRMEEMHTDVFLPGRSAGDVAKAKKQGKIASFITVENGAALEGRIELLEAFRDLGVRLMTLCHNNTTDWCDSATDKPKHGGLSDFGKRVITRMNELGLIVDLAHVAPSVMSQVLDISSAPVVWSHSNARKLSSHPRNIPEDILDRVAKNDGLVMATWVPDFISQASNDWMAVFKDKYGRKKGRHTDLEAMIAEREKSEGPWPRGDLKGYCDQLDYLKGRIGIDHLGIGSDLYGGPQGKGLENASCFPAVFAELFKRGWGERELEKLASGNMLRLFRAVEKAAR